MAKIDDFSNFGKFFEKASIFANILEKTSFFVKIWKIGNIFQNFDKNHHVLPKFETCVVLFSVLQHYSTATALVLWCHSAVLSAVLDPLHATTSNFSNIKSVAAVKKWNRFFFYWDAILCVFMLWETWNSCKRYELSLAECACICGVLG